MLKYLVHVFCILCNSLVIIEKLNTGLSLHFVVFGFILFQYDLQITSLPDSSSYSLLPLCPNRTPEFYICAQISGWVFFVCV